MDLASRSFFLASSDAVLWRIFLAGGLAGGSTTILVLCNLPLLFFFVCRVCNTDQIMTLLIKIEGVSGSLMPCPFTGPKMFCASLKILTRPKCFWTRKRALISYITCHQWKYISKVNWTLFKWHWKCLETIVFKKQKSNTAPSSILIPNCIRYLKSNWITFLLKNYYLQDNNMFFN